MKFGECECDGFFLLSAQHESFADFHPDGADLGTGGGMQTWRFQSAEGRTYFKRTLELDSLLSIAVGNTKALENRVLDCITPKGRIRRKRFLKLAESIKGA